MSYPLWYNDLPMAEFLKKVGNLKLYIRKDKEDTASFFAKDIARKLREFHNEERRDVLFLSSGGSAFDVLDGIDEKVISPYLTIGVLDERFDPSNKTSNYAQLRKTAFYKRAVARGCRLIDTSTKNGQTEEVLADFYETELRSWRALHPKGIIMATMGVAPDGHTAGIMPFPEDPERFHALFDDGKHWVVPYDATGKNPDPRRVTTTLTFLRQIDIVGVFMVDAKKGPIFRELIAGDNYADLPGCIIKTLPRGAVYVSADLVRAAGYAAPGKYS